jgi:hypothetical protein
LRTPTGPFFGRFFIGIILGLVAEFAFMVPSTRMVLSSSAARWKSNRNWTTAKLDAALPRPRKAGIDALADHAALELSEDTAHLKHGAA